MDSISGPEDPLEGGMATCSSIQGTEEPGRQFMGQEMDRLKVTT